MRRRSDTALTFVDFLFNLLLVFVSLFILSFLLINPEAQNKKIDPNAEFLIIMTWPGEMNDDVDLWAEDPDGNVVYFNTKEAGLMHLDRDDLGDASDRFRSSDGEVATLQHNQETITIRGVSSGEYVVNIFMFSKSSKTAVPVTVQVIKLNPFWTIVEKTLSLTRNGEEKTVVRFTLDSRGSVINKNNLFKSLARSL